MSWCQVDSRRGATIEHKRDDDESGGGSKTEEPIREGKVVFVELWRL